MAILEPILYANGALRLTDHGPRGGGLVLVHVPSNRQLSIAYGVAKKLTEEMDDLEDEIDSTIWFNQLWRWEAPRGAYRAWLQAQQHAS